MKTISFLLLTSLALALPEQYHKDLDPEDNPQDFIAVYECKNGKLKLTWHTKNLSPKDLKELKKLEGQPCKK